MPENLSLCRLCAKKHSQNTLIKMSSDEFMKYNLAEKIHQYFIITITENDSLPKDVCNYCFKKVLETYEFHQQIEKAQELLEDLMLHKIEIKEESGDNQSEHEDSYKFLFDNSLFEDTNDDDPLVTRMKNKSSIHEGNIKDKAIIEPKETKLKGNTSKKRRKKGKVKGLVTKIKYKKVEKDPTETIDRELKKIILFGIKEEAFICERCGKSFPRVGILNAHLKTHSEEKPFKCDECSKFFKDIYGLKKHKMCHSGVRPHVCTVCGLKFSRKWIHDRHTLRHSKTTDFECRFCSKQFKEAYYLKVHLRQHTGERPYSCTECNHFFANSSNFIKHLRGKHRLRNFSIANQHQYPFVNN